MLTRLVSTIAILAFPLAVFATDYRTVEHPRQECWNEQIPVQSGGPGGYGGAIVGGIAGGLLGNQVGGGNGRTVATAVGAMTGAVVGDRMSSRTTSYQTVQRCRTVIDREQVPVMIVNEPVPVVEQRVYYIDREERHYRREHWNRGHHHGHHDDDDDDD